MRPSASSLRTALVTLAASLACGPQPREQPDPRALEQPPPDLPPDPEARLDRSPAPRRDGAAVYHDDFARPVLYTWTTPAQVEALRASRRLLVADGDVGERSPYLRALDRAIDARSPGSELAAVLRDHPGLRRRRYAWTSPFATTLGLGTRRYGDALVRVELAPGALIVAFRPHAAEPFALMDMSGRTVDLAVALAEPGRIGAVYHVRDGPGDPVHFREYVLCNESQVAAWSVATPEIRARVDAEIALLERLGAGDLAHLPDAAVRSPASAAWATAPAPSTPLDRWHAGLAFDNDRYRPTPDNLAAVAAALRGYDGRGAPLVHRPDATFP